MKMASFLIQIVSFLIQLALLAGVFLTLVNLDYTSMKISHLEGELTREGNMSRLNHDITQEQIQELRDLYYINTGA